MTVALRGRSKAHQSGHQGTCKFIIDSAFSAAIISNLLQKERERRRRRRIAAEKGVLRIQKRVCLYVLIMQYNPTCSGLAQRPAIHVQARVFLSQPLDSRLAVSEKHIMVHGRKKLFHETFRRCQGPHISYVFNPDLSPFCIHDPLLDRLHLSTYTEWLD